jgi:hypothetical protein
MSIVFRAGNCPEKNPEKKHVVTTQTDVMMEASFLKIL